MEENEEVEGVHNNNNDNDNDIYIYISIYHIPTLNRDIEKQMEGNQRKCVEANKTRKKDN